MNELLANLPILQENAPASGGFDPMQFLPIVLIFVVFYFLIIRPQQKKQKDTVKMREGLKKGDPVVTIGGIFGTIVSIKDNKITLKVDDNTKLVFVKNAIDRVVKPEDEKKVEDTKEKK
jgi:preprotein translocase subunit YajC